MKSKRTQQDIIVTVLLVLIALAAVALIATFVVRNVRENTTNADNQANCLKVTLSIAKATAGETTVGVKREAGGEDVKVSNLKLIVAGTIVNETADDPDILATSSVSTGTKTLVSGDKVEAAVVLENGYTCPATATFTVA